MPRIHVRCGTLSNQGYREICPEISAIPSNVTFFHVTCNDLSGNLQMNFSGVNINMIKTLQPSIIPSNINYTLYNILTNRR